jgi:uncharacterized protein YndB with AHSA1/START domain
VGSAPPRRKHTLRNLFLGLLAVVIILVIVVAVQPSEFRVTRSTVIAVPPAEAFAQVNNFHHWEAWSPWAKLDPQSTAEFDGPPSGKGAIFEWSGNDQVGEGRMTITESRPYELIRIRLDFIKPMTDTSTAEFTFAPEGEQTKVTWSMFGKSNFFQKAICLVMNMDQMLGGYFEIGLAQMKKVAETDSAVKSLTPADQPGSAAEASDSTDPFSAPTRKSAEPDKPASGAAD